MMALDFISGLRYYGDAATLSDGSVVCLTIVPETFGARWTLTRQSESGLTLGSAWVDVPDGCVTTDEGAAVIVTHLADTLCV